METSPENVGNEADLPHSLVPLTLAAVVVRCKAYGERQITDQGPVGDLNMLANFIAFTVPLYEYFSDPSEPPRALDKAALEGGIFREGGKEIRFLETVEEQMSAFATLPEDVQIRFLTSGYGLPVLGSTMALTLAGGSLSRAKKPKPRIEKT